MAAVKASDGRTIYLLDTPGLSDPESSEREVHAQIIASMAAMAQAHPDARFSVALVASLAGRLDEAVLSAFSNLGLVFGARLFDHATLICTHGDLLLEESNFDTATQPDDAALDAAYVTYLASAGETLTTWLGRIKGGSLVLSNRGGNQAPGVELSRLVERAWAVAGRASQLAPPKPHRKHARRQRQQEMLRDRHQPAWHQVQPERRTEYEEPAARGVFAFSRLLDCLHPLGTRALPGLSAGGSGAEGQDQEQLGELELLERGKDT